MPTVKWLQYRMRGEAVALRGERHRRNKPLADDGDHRMARLAGSVNQHDVDDMRGKRWRRYESLSITNAIRDSAGASDVK